jgi:hypothetical protein
MPQIEAMYGSSAAERMNTDGALESFVRQLSKTRNRIEQLMNDDVPNAEQHAVQERCGEMRAHFDEGRAALISVEGQPAAMAYQEYIGQWCDGRPVYEIGGLVTLPDYEGNGYSSQARKCCMENVLREKSNALFFGITTQPRLVERYKRGENEGWAKSISAEEYEAWRRQLKKISIAVSGLLQWKRVCVRRRLARCKRIICRRAV